jgi:predicted 2-oxoglutarate/Fe(II)-dependent dioxygenase YbiX
MISSLIENNYVVVPGFIATERAIKLSAEFKSYCEKECLMGDEQVTHSSAKYDYISFLELLCEKSPKVSSIIGETVLPTYSYARVYRRGNVLPPHVDRKACEISITVNLDCDTPWDIWIETPTGERRNVTLKSGDAMIYLGCAAIHWRDQFPGDFCSQVFLHYVRSRGPYSSVYFDKKEYHSASDILNKNETLVEMEITEREPIIEIEKKPDVHITYKSKNPLDEYIKVFYSVLSDETCDLILNEYSNSEDWIPSKTGMNEVNKNIRNCDNIGISQANTINKNPEIRQKIDNLIFEGSGKALKKYIETFPTCDVTTDSGYDLLRYLEGGYYSEHTDSFKEIPRSVSCSFNLNDDYEGGEFSFFGGEVIIRAPKGSAIVFPSNFMYPHEIKKVTKGERYSIVTWFI